MSGINPRDIDLNKIRITGSTSHRIELPFELTARDFLNFATDDLTGRSPRNTVNALSNIKRSIDCLFDSLLFITNFLQDSKDERWNFPEKMKFLGEIGIITPYILGRINSARNLLEHEFKKPTREDVEMAYDVALLLYYATTRFTTRHFRQLELSDELELVINLKREDRRIDVCPTTKEGVLLKDGEISISWDKSPEDYKRWLYVIYQIRYLE